MDFFIIAAPAKLEDFMFVNRVSELELLEKLEETMVAVENVPSLRGVIAGPLPAGLRYDPLVGLVST